MNQKFRLTAAFLATALSVSAGLASSLRAEALLSPALEVIAADFEVVRTGVAGADIRFSEECFAQALGLSKLGKVTISSLPDPSLGVLRLGSRDVEDGQVISAKNLESLRFVPNGKEPLEASFEFRVGSDVDYTCRVFALDRINRAPVIAQSELVDAGVYAGLDRLGTVKASDPDGDSLKLEIVTEPIHGSVTLTSPELGHYVYTPDEDYDGVDSFTVCAVDRYGARSSETRISLRVDSLAENELPEELYGHWAASAIVSCKRAGLISDELTAKLELDPDRPMSRAEFVDFMMRSAGYGSFSVSNTGFADDSSIPEEYRGSIAAAAALGVVAGIESDTGLCFYPNNQITRAEASVMLARLTGAIWTAADIAVEVSLDPSVPTWAMASMKALAAEGILRGTLENGVVSLSPYASVTFGMAAQLASGLK